MEKEQIESLLIDYIDGTLSESKRQQVEALLEQNGEVQILYKELRTILDSIKESSTLEPRYQMKIRFEQILEQEIKSQERKHFFINFSPLKLAASIALLMLGVVIGYFINKNYQQEQEMIALRKQMEEMKQLMMVGLNNEFSPSKRMTAVAVALQIEKPDQDIVNALTKTMLEDENTNVRLAALEALTEFSENPDVRKSLIESLQKQKDPLVQISLIQWMVGAKEKSVVRELEKITTDENVIKAVRDEAYKGLLKLS